MRSSRLRRRVSRLDVQRRAPVEVAAAADVAAVVLVVRVVAGADVRVVALPQLRVLRPLLVVWLLPVVRAAPAADVPVARLPQVRALRVARVADAVAGPAARRSRRAG